MGGAQLIGKIEATSPGTGPPQPALGSLAQAHALGAGRSLKVSGRGPISHFSFIIRTPRRVSEGRALWRGITTGGEGLRLYPGERHWENPLPSS